MTPNRERTYEAIYAAAFVRELYADVAIDGFGVALRKVEWCHRRAEQVANEWMVQTAEGEDK